MPIKILPNHARFCFPAVVIFLVPLLAGNFAGFQCGFLAEWSSSGVVGGCGEVVDSVWGGLQAAL